MTTFWEPGRKRLKPHRGAAVSNKNHVKLFHHPKCPLVFFLSAVLLAGWLFQMEDVLLEIGPAVNQTMTPTEMFVALSDMLPDHQGSCPDLPGYPAKLFSQSDLHLCANLLQRASDQNNCIIYNFGVNKRDQFLELWSADIPPWPNCQVYAFDPFVLPNQIQFTLGPNVHFYEIGLWNGYSDRRVGNTPNKTGRLMTLMEIQQMLNHTSPTTISYFRSDCEGCEYGWVQQAMHDPTIFQRIDQMFMEIHTVPISFMSSIQLQWTDGLPPTSLLRPVYDMLSQNFDMLSTRVNPGGPLDRNQVPSSLQEAGVLRYPCCRELNMIHRQLAAPPRKPECDTPRWNRFQTCPEQPTCLGKHCYCASLLVKDEQENRCQIYFFGNFQDPQEVRLVTQLAKDHPRCGIRAFDPRWNASLEDLPNLQFQPFGIYGGSGHRVIRTTETNVVGELYTLMELFSHWSRKGNRFRNKEIATISPSRISLFRIDWTSASPCVWQKEILSNMTTWWGTYSGHESIQQLMYERG